MRPLLVAGLLLSVILAAPLTAMGGGHHGGGHDGGGHHSRGYRSGGHNGGGGHHGGGHHSSGHHGRIKRSSTAREQFMRKTGYPHGRPGYVIDHIVALSKGGSDDPSNMQWQTVQDAKAKDKWERK